MNTKFTIIDCLIVFIIALSLSVFTEWYERNNDKATKDIVLPKYYVVYFDDGTVNEFTYDCTNHNYILIDTHSNEFKKISKEKLSQLFDITSTLCK